MNIKGFSHITINVSSLTTALPFYEEILKMRVAHRGTHDAYLEWGDAWICLQDGGVRPTVSCRTGVDHVAFYIDAIDFPMALERLRQAQVPVVRGPLQRGLGWSINFLDPDGTQLELHTSTLAERMTVWS